MNTPTVDHYMRNENVLNKYEVRRLQDEHNVNVHASADDCEDFFDNDDSDLEGLHIVDEQEFFERFCE